MNKATGSNDIIIRATASSGQIRAFAVSARDMVEYAREAHNTSPVVTAALGRMLSAGAMMGAMMKGKDDLLTLQIRGSGPMKGITVTAGSPDEETGMVDVKGYALVPDVILPAKVYPLANGPERKLDVGGAIGIGVLSVIKDMGLKEPYSGQIPIYTGEIAEDITQYLAVSEQTPGACALGVLINPDLTVKCAGGFLIQVLPFAPEEAISQLEKNLSGVTSVTAMIEQGMTPEDIALKMLDGLEPNVLDDFEVNYVCDCSRERTERMLISLGRNELTELAKDAETEICCNFCDKKYIFTSEDILKLIGESSE